MLLLLKRVYLYWKYEFSRKCRLYFIKRIHWPIETSLDFFKASQKFLIKLCFRKLVKQENFLKILRKLCKNYLWNIFFFKLQAFSLQSYKKNFCGYITNTPSCLWNRLCWTLIIATLNIHTYSFVDESVFLSEYFLKISVRSTEVRLCVKKPLG